MADGARARQIKIMKNEIDKTLVWINEHLDAADAGSTVLAPDDYKAIYRLREIYHEWLATNGFKR